MGRQTRSGRVLIVGTYRDVAVHPDHPLEAILRDLSREQVMERVTLKRLGESETSSLITETVGELEAVPEFAALVYRHTDGNPFFTQQVLQALVENGSLYQQDGRWQRRAIGEIEVPESVRSVIAQRVAHLSPEAQEVLQEASVLGPTFTFDDLLKMKSPSGSPDMEDALDIALSDAASFRLVILTGKDRYEFDHALTQHALYTTLTPRRRRRLHLAAGESMENLPERIRSQRAAEMAWHFLQGDDEEKAIRYSLLAGDQAESVFAHQEAERHYRTALELAGETGDAPREVEALEKLGVVLRTMGRYDEALEMLETAARLQHETGDLEGEGQVVAQIGVLCNLSGAAEYGISRVQPLVEALERLPPTRSLALLYAALVRLYNFIGSQADQLDTTERLLDLTRRLTDDRLLAEAEVHRGVSLMYLGRYEEALQLLESAIPRAESIGDLHTVCLALDFGSLIYHAWHQLKQARIYRDRSVEVAERLGDPREIAHRATEAAYLTFLIGDWDASREYAERAVTSAMEQDNLRTFVQPLYTLAELALYSGDREDAAGYLQESTTIAVHLGLTSHLREVQALLAEQDLLDGNPQSALERFRSVLDSPGWEEHPTFLVCFAATCVEAGDLRSAQDAVIKAVGVATQQRLPVILVDAHRVQAAIAREHGAWEDAESHIELAIGQSRDIAYPWGEARALYDYGALLVQEGDNARAVEKLREATAIFERLGARPYRMRAERLIEPASAGGLTPLQPPR
jgi:tetratricopeptide (TPR) repeat protein